MGFEFRRRTSAVFSGVTAVFDGSVIYDRSRESGMAIIVEHMFFKWTDTFWNRNFTTVSLQMSDLIKNFWNKRMKDFTAFY